MLNTSICHAKGAILLTAMVLCAAASSCPHLSTLSPDCQNAFRSTWLGSGAYAAHWTGDTLSSEKDMRWSIPAVMNSGLAGITFAGADICGFSMYASEALCARWAALGAWYPYSRNHHADGFQEFYRCVRSHAWLCVHLCLIVGLGLGLGLCVHMRHWTEHAAPIACS